MPQIQQEMPSAAAKLKMLEIDNIDEITANLKKFFKT